MASSLALKRLLSSSTRYLNPFLRQSAASSNALHASDRLDHRCRFSSSPDADRLDPFSWRRSSIVGQSSQYSSVASGIGDMADTGKEETVKKNVLRPLSPHLPIYKPQLSSTTSILNRISGIYLSAYVLGFYLVPIKLGAVGFSYEGFNQFLFYSSKLSLLSTEIAALAFAYHAYSGGMISVRIASSFTFAGAIRIYNFFIPLRENPRTTGHCETRMSKPFYT